MIYIDAVLEHLECVMDMSLDNAEKYDKASVDYHLLKNMSPPCNSSAGTPHTVSTEQRVSTL